MTLRLRTFLTGLMALLVAVLLAFAPARAKPPEQDTTAQAAATPFEARAKLSCDDAPRLCNSGSQSASDTAADLAQDFTNGAGIGVTVGSLVAGELMGWVRRNAEADTVRAIDQAGEQLTTNRVACRLQPRFAAGLCPGALNGSAISARVVWLTIPRPVSG
ncbi:MULTISPECIES: hypothetical protein [unclassified Yoonia]|uniref:hypothetical protein n=1 Tax=unclassified Yoonia TaxID=2629118 RepID=UPI002AFE7B07|nr:MULTISPECIES: hypothetical protein [unclassified Yoonia]